MRKSPKTIISLFLLIFLACEVFAQVRPARKKHYELFYNSTTFVVLHRDPFSEFNKYMQEAMEKHWTITPFRFITFEEFERMRTNERASFMILADIEQKNLDHTYSFINFVMGDSKRDFEGMPDLASVPLSYLDADDYNHLYKMGAFVKFMQTHARDSDSTPRMRLAKIMNVRDDQLKQMELWVLKHELDPRIDTEEKIRKYYPYRVKIATQQEIEQAIAEDRADVAFFHKIGPEDTTRNGRGICWKFIVSAKDGSILYSSSHDVSNTEPDALLISDLEKMAK